MFRPEIINGLRELAQTLDFMRLQRLDEVLPPGFEALEVLRLELIGDGLLSRGVIRHPGIRQEEVVDLIQPTDGLLRV